MEDKPEIYDKSNRSMPEYLTLSDAAKTLPRMNGRRIHTSTLWRWCMKGLRGYKLEYVRVGQKIATTSEALNRFFVSLAEADNVKQFSSDVHWPRKRRRPSDKARQRSIEEADAILRRAKII